ncbi:hypothetical protein D3C77_486740 [compost metagenome]
MKSKYRQAVESVIAQEAKLAEVTQLYEGAVARERQLAEALRLNQETLARYEGRVLELEPQMVTNAEGKSEPEVRL